MDGMNNPADAGDEFHHFDAATLVGDLRDAMLAELKDGADGKPWNERPEAQQRAVVDRIHAAARGMVNRAVLLMSDKGFASLLGELVQVQVKDGFKAVVEIPRGSEFRHELVDRQGKEVVLVLADADDFRGTRGAVPITPHAPLLDYAEQAARVADAAETPPEGWAPQEVEPGTEPGSGLTVIDEAGEVPVSVWGALGGDPVAAAPAQEQDDGLVMTEPSFLTGMEGRAHFAVVPIADAKAIWFCWKDGAGTVRCHEDQETAAEIAARQSDAEDAAWQTAEERAKPKKRQRRGDDEDEGMVA